MSISLGFTYFLLFTCCFLGSELWASYELEKLPSYLSCPFQHSDTYANDMSRLHLIIKQQIKTKIDGNSKCNSLFNNVSQSFDNINTLFSYRGSRALYEELKEEVLSKQIIQLKLNQIIQDPSDASYAAIEEKIIKLEDQIYSNEIEKIYNQDIFTENKVNSALKDTFSHFSSVINSLSTADPECISQLGGWRQVLPTLLNSMSSLSGLSGYAYSALVGSGLKVLSSLTFLFQDYSAKKALKEIIQYQNNKILACLYFSVQHTACEYRRALGYSEQEEKIKDIINQKYTDSQTKLYDEFFMLVEHSYDFEKVFFDIATMGSAVTLDVNLISRYFIARRANPETILNSDDLGTPPPYEDVSPEAEELRQSWLIAVKTRGINFAQRTNMGLKTLRDQAKEALADISAKIADIKSVEKILIGTRSFVDLKHELDTNPRLIYKINKYIQYFKKVLNNEIIQTKKKGIVAAALRVLMALEQFVSFNYEGFIHGNESMISYGNRLDTQVELYIKEINKRGKRVFSVMSEGAVAQVSKQTILTVGTTVQDRIIRVFRLIEEEFINRELYPDESSPQDPKPVKYSEYKRDKMMLIKVAQNYLAFSANARTFRIEDVELAKKSIEKSFGKEIYSMTKKALKDRSSDLFPTLEGETASHLCALFSSSLVGSKKFGGTRLLRVCKKYSKPLGLVKIFKSKNLQIRWDDPCYYSNYWRIVSAQKAIFNKYLSSGFKP